MSSYKQAKQKYIDKHLSKSLKSPERRLNALSGIEERIVNALFEQLDRAAFSARYEQWKGTPLSAAEKSVIKGLYNIKEGKA